MKLYKALKLRKNLIGEITNLKEQIKQKNSYIEGSKNGEKFDVNKAYQQLLAKVDELSGLKYVINEANREIQSKIYVLGEYKALISFWKEVSVIEGTQVIGYSDKPQNYIVQVDENQRDEIINNFQKRVDAIQEELDTYNFNTEIPWGEATAGELETIENNLEIRTDCDCGFTGNCCGPVDTKE